MRTLIAEDDQTSALVLVSMLKPYGSVMVARDGDALVRDFTAGLVQQQPYDLVCLDIKMPGLDGQACLRCLRAVEKAFGREGAAGTKVLMTTSVNTPESIFTAFRGQAEGYLIKPIDRAKLTAQLAQFGFIAA